MSTSSLFSILDNIPKKLSESLKNEKDDWILNRKIDSINRTTSDILAKSEMLNFLSITGDISSEALKMRREYTKELKENIVSFNEQFLSLNAMKEINLGSNNKIENEINNYFSTSKDSLSQLSNELKSKFHQIWLPQENVNTLISLVENSQINDNEIKLDI